MTSISKSRALTPRTSLINTQLLFPLKHNDQCIYAIIGLQSNKVTRISSNWIYLNAQQQAGDFDSKDTSVFFYFTVCFNFIVSMFTFSVLILSAIILLLANGLRYPSVSLLITLNPPSIYTKPSYSCNSFNDDTSNCHEKIENDLRRTENSLEIRHIGFLKVHKAGSTTLQNIFFRFGVKRNLTFVLPKDRYHLNIEGNLPVRTGGHYDILAVHSTYKKEIYDKILPRDKVNIAIVREPIDRLISAAYYYRDVIGSRYLKKIPQETFIQDLIINPEKYDKKIFSETKNAMGRDFGFRRTISVTDSDKISMTLNFLEKEFVLVLLTERFDESLVLMKRHLNWDLSDILYIARNTHAHQPVNISEKLREKYKNTSFMDFAIYNHFKKIFDDKIAAKGPDFHQEVEFLQFVLNKTNSFCQTDKINQPFLDIPASAWNYRFKILESDCKLMQIKAHTFIDNLKIRHNRMNEFKEN